MSYNILNYNSTDANSTRYLDLRTIIANEKPDVLMLCEISSPGAPKLLLDSALNKAGAGTYTMGTFMDGPDTDNMLYYKTGRIKLKSQLQISTTLRDISQYRIYLVPATNDTAFIYLHMAHLKAGSLASDEFQRQTEANNFCTAIANIPTTANVLFAGDLNLKSSAEGAYSQLTSGCSHLMIDPINQPGLWNNNSQFKTIFTQSTRSSSNPGCCGGATGGLDDRFDIIFLNSPMLNGSDHVSYLPGSYRTVGNDGQHMNLSMIDPPANIQVPGNVAQALFNMSDHLPVSLKLVIKESPQGVREWAKNKLLPKMWFVNQEGSGYLGVTTEVEGNYNLTVLDPLGRILICKSITLKKGYQTIDLQTADISNGYYQAVLKNENGATRCSVLLGH